MPDRSDIIRNRFTDLTDWGTFRDRLVDELIQARFPNASQIIRSKFNPNHFHNPPILADLIQEATNCHEGIHTALRSSSDDLDVLLTINEARDLLEGDGSFNSTQDWLTQTGWSVTGGAAEANIDTLEPARQVYKDVSNLTVGTQYLFEFEIAAHTTGAIRPIIRGSSAGVGGNHDAVATYQEIVLPNAGPNGFGFVTNAGEGFVGAIHDFVVRRIP